MGFGDAVEDSGMSDPVPGGERPAGAGFELDVSIPCDARYAETVRELAIYAARQAGCSDDRARAFGLEVEQATRGYIENSGGDTVRLPLVVRRRTGPVEVLVNGRTLSADP
jgi:hypothetical protein